MQHKFCRPQRYMLQISLWRVVLLIASLCVISPAQVIVLAATAQVRNQFMPAGTVNAQAAGGDITSLITANGGNDNIILNGGDYTITLPQNAPLAKASWELPAVPTTIFNGVISGTGTITVQVPSSGTGTLLLSNTSTYSLPTSQLKEWEGQQHCAPYAYDNVLLKPGCPAYVNVLRGHNAPALIIKQGATVDFDDTNSPQHATAILRNFDTATQKYTRGTYNLDNIENDGLMVVTNVYGGTYSTVFGQISGTGSVINHVGAFEMEGMNTYTGYSVLSGANIYGDHNFGSLPNSKVIFNGFVLAYAIPEKTKASASDIARGYPEFSPGFVKVPQQIYEYHHGNSIHNQGFGVVDFTGKYNYTDSGDDIHPSLSNPALNFCTCSPGNISHRILYLYGITQFGDGTNADFFLPANPGNGTIRFSGGSMGFDYNGAVTLNVPINNPLHVDSGNVFILGTSGNHVTFAQPQYYNGLTQIDANAILQLGDGTGGNDNPNFSYTSPKTGVTHRGDYSTSGGNGSLTTADSPGGAPTDRIIDNGQLIVDNVTKALNGVGAISLSNISGTGSLVQEGTATLTLGTNTTYTGATTISNGTLALASNGSIASSSEVNLTSSTAALDLSQAGNQTIKNLSGVSGSTIYLGSNTLTVENDKATTFAGTIVGNGHIVKAGTGTLTLTGKNVSQSVQQVTPQATSQATSQIPVTVSPGTTLTGQGTIDNTVVNSGTVVPGASNSPTSSATSPGVTILHDQDDRKANPKKTVLHGTLTIHDNYIQALKNSDLEVHLDGNQSTQLNVLGRVSLGGSLHVILDKRPNNGEKFTIIHNSSSLPIWGTFNGLSEGERLTVDGANFEISYHGGTGNDVALTAVNDAQSSGSTGFNALLIGLVGLVILVIVGIMALGLIIVRRQRQRYAL